MKLASTSTIIRPELFNAYTASYSMRLRTYDQIDGHQNDVDLREYATSATGLEHPSLLKVVDVQRSNQGRWRVLIADGTTTALAAEEITGGELEPEEALAVVATLVSAYRYLHERAFRGRRHFAWSDDCVRIWRTPENHLQMGVVPPLPSDVVSSPRQADEKTSSQESSRLGAVEYTAPELISDPAAEPTEASDSFTVAAVLFHLIRDRPWIGRGELVSLQDEALQGERAVASALEAARQEDLNLPGHLPDLIRLAFSSTPELRPGLGAWASAFAACDVESLQAPHVAPGADAFTPDDIAAADGFTSVLKLPEDQQDHMTEPRSQLRGFDAGVEPSREEMSAKFSFARHALYDAAKVNAHLPRAELSKTLDALEVEAEQCLQANDVERWLAIEERVNGVIEQLRADSLGASDQLDPKQLRAMLMHRANEIRQQISSRHAKGGVAAEHAERLTNGLSVAETALGNVDLSDKAAARSELLAIGREHIAPLEQHLVEVAGETLREEADSEDKTHQTHAPTDGGEPPQVHENVQFTVYRPKTIAPEIWYDLLAFAHLDEKAPDAPAAEPEPLEKVKRQAKQVLGSRVKQYQDTTQDSIEAIPHQGELTFVPEMEGVQFNPPRASIHFAEDVHSVNFRVRAGKDCDGTTVRGRLSVFLGAILLADVVLKVKVDSAQREAEPPEPQPLRRYRRIFASYSHRDLEIVEQFERFAEAMGDRYLRDWKDLRSGEKWDERLLQMIEEADVFQLFWSKNAMRSPYCRREWEHALNLRREGFIRPTYWENPMPQDRTANLPPPDLADLHFTQLGQAEPQDASSGAQEDDAVDAFGPGGDELVMDGGDSDIALARGDSGIDMADANDGDASLEDESVELTTSDESAAMPDEDAMPALEDEEADSDARNQLEADGDFLLTPGDDAGDDELDSDSQVIAFETDQFDEEDDMEELMGESDMMEGFGEEDDMMASAGPTVFGEDDFGEAPVSDYLAPEPSMVGQPMMYPAASHEEARTPVWQIALVIGLFVAMVLGFVAFIVLSESGSEDENGSPESSLDLKQAVAASVDAPLVRVDHEGAHMCSERFVWKFHTGLGIHRSEPACDRRNQSSPGAAVF